jgi:hypothetical protein
MRAIGYVICGLALLAGVGEAEAATTVFSLNCTGAFGQLTTAILNNSWTSVSGSDVTVQPGDVIALDGICDDVVYPFFGVTISNHTYNVSSNTTPSLVAGDGIEGQVIVSHAQTAVTLIGITIEGQTGGSVPALDVDMQSQVSVANSSVTESTGPGIIVDRSSSATLTNTTVSHSGQAGVAGQDDGIEVVRGSSLILGALQANGSVDSTQAVTVSSNSGNGIVATGNSSLSIAGGSVTGNSEAQIFVAGGSSARIDGALVTSTTPPNLMPAALVGIGGAAILLTGGADVSGSTFATAAIIESLSSLVLNGSTVSTALASGEAIRAAESSNLISYGGNTIENTGASGIAIEIEENSAFLELLPSGTNTEPLKYYATQLAAGFTGTPATPSLAADTITGAGSIQIESNMELGTGATTSNWTGAITVAQNSSVRMDGGITVTGTVTITQASNGFFNTALGGQNIVSGGVSCPFAATAGARIAGPSKVLLSSGGASAVTIGNTSPDCQEF